MVGGLSGGGPPDPISNSEVKPSSADGTATETLWESRSSPTNLFKRYARYLFKGSGRFAFLGCFGGIYSGLACELRLLKHIVMRCELPCWSVQWRRMPCELPCWSVRWHLDVVRPTLWVCAMVSRCRATYLVGLCNGIGCRATYLVGHCRGISMLFRTMKSCGVSAAWPW